MQHSNDKEDLLCLSMGALHYNNGHCAQLGLLLKEQEVVWYIFTCSQPTKMHFCGILKGGGNTLFEGILVFIIFRSTRIAHQFVHFQLVGGIQEKSLCRLVKMMIVCSHLRLPHLSEIGPHPLQRHHSLKQTKSTIKKI